MADSSNASLGKLLRFRRLAEDKAAAQLQISSENATEAGTVLDDVRLRRDAITAEKTSVEAGGAVSLDRYALCLHLEIEASERFAQAESLLEQAELARETSRLRYRNALDAVRLVEKRDLRRTQSDQIRAERIEADRMSELWLGRRMHDPA